jgi:integrase
MAHIQKRCNRRECRRRVTEGSRACTTCGSRTFSYVMRYVDPSGAERSESFARRADADTRLLDLETAKRRNTYVDPAAGRETLDAFYRRWRGAVSLAPSTLAKYEGIWRLYVEPRLGGYPLAAITRENVRATVAAVSSPWQASETLKLLRSLLNRALDADLIGRNPAARIPAPRTDRGAVRVLTPTDLARVVEVLPERWRAFALTGAYSSVRWSELCALKRDDLDLEARTLRVDEKVVEVRGSFEWGFPKTPRSRRVVDLPELLARPLAEHLLRYPPLRDQDDASLERLVFYGERGGPVRRHVFRKVWSAACQAAQVPYVRPEWLRHTGASIAYAATRDMKAVAARLGHTSTRMMDTVYVEVYPQVSRQVADAIDSLVESAWT